MNSKQPCFGLIRGQVLAGGFGRWPVSLIRDRRAGDGVLTQWAKC
ncbi:MAG: hypothetical protein ACE5IY_11315 [bacterium]